VCRVTLGISIIVVMCDCHLVRFGREAAILILELRVSVGSLTAARHNSLGVCYIVPFSASQEALLRVSFREKRRSDSICQGRESAVTNIDPHLVEL
jgi:hypothetical protein